MEQYDPLSFYLRRGANQWEYMDLYRVQLNRVSD